MNHRQHLARVALAVTSGAAVGAISHFAGPRRDVLVPMIAGYDAAALVYLSSVWLHLVRAGAKLSAAAEEDEGHVAITAGVLAAAVVGIGAVSLLINNAGNWARLGLCVATILLCWLLVQTVFAAHYANQYRQGMASDGKRPGLAFDGDEDRLTFLDFVYFAFTVGLTFQVSDVTTNTRDMRRLVTLHAVVAFLFNSSVIAIVVGAATSWFQR